MIGETEKQRNGETEKRRNGEMVKWIYFFILSPNTFLNFSSFGRIT